MGAVMVRELFAGETMAAADALLDLREAVGPAERLVARIDDLQRPEGYRLVASFDEEGRAVAAAGFRVGHNLAWGRFLYVDDLITFPRRAARATPPRCCAGCSTRPPVSVAGRSISTREPSDTPPIVSIWVWACTSAPTTSVSTHPQSPGPVQTSKGRRD